LEEIKKDYVIRITIVQRVIINLWLVIQEVRFGVCKTKRHQEKCLKAQLQNTILIVIVAGMKFLYVQIICAKENGVVIAQTKNYVKMKIARCVLKSHLHHIQEVHFGVRKNKDKTPRCIFKNTKESCYFDCDKCGHTFDSILSNIVSLNQWCPYCRNLRRCEGYCEKCYAKSFASHPRAEFWSDKNDVTPDTVAISTPAEFIFNCDKCPHEFEKSCVSIVSMNSWCPYCANQKLCKNDNCVMCFENSFASHPLSIYWSDKNKLNARDVFMCSEKEYYLFKCDKCPHEFKKNTWRISEKRKLVSLLLT
jgi:hypothetical protein